MTSSGTYAFSLSTGDAVVAAFERVKIRAPSIRQEHMRTARNEMRDCIVYCAINLSNPNRVYIGVTAKSLECRKYHHFYAAKHGSALHFHRALRKYGKEGFNWQIICECKSYKDAFDTEVALIAELRTTHNLYNMTDGVWTGLLESSFLRDLDERCHWPKLVSQITGLMERCRRKYEIGFCCFTQI